MQTRDEDFVGLVVMMVGVLYKCGRIAKDGLIGVPRSYLENPEERLQSEYQKS